MAVHIVEILVEKRGDNHATSYNVIDDNSGLSPLPKLKEEGDLDMVISDARKTANEKDVPFAIVDVDLWLRVHNIRSTKQST